MQITYERCCGLDGHTHLGVACLLTMGVDAQRHPEVRRFSTMTQDLLALADWLTTAGCTHVAMESTGVCWNPISHRLEGWFEVLVVTAQHLKAVPGRKTDVRAAEWIAEVRQQGRLARQFDPTHASTRSARRGSLAPHPR